MILLSVSQFKTIIFSHHIMFSAYILLITCSFNSLTTHKSCAIQLTEIYLQISCYLTNGCVFTHNGHGMVSEWDEQRGIIHLILDALEDKLLISKNDENKEYVVAHNIDLKNDKYNMAVSGSVADGREIELISFKIIQR